MQQKANRGDSWMHVNKEEHPTVPLWYSNITALYHYSPATKLRTKWYGWSAAGRGCWLSFSPWIRISLLRLHMVESSALLPLLSCFLITVRNTHSSLSSPSSIDDGPFYDATAYTKVIIYHCLWLFLSIYIFNKQHWRENWIYTKCIEQPQKPLYNGGILSGFEMQVHMNSQANDSSSPYFDLRNLTKGTHYCFSSWVILLQV